MGGQRLHGDLRRLPPARRPGGRSARAPARVRRRACSCSAPPRWPAAWPRRQLELIAARAIQGLGGAVIAPASLSILTTTFPEGAARNRAVGIWGAMGGAGGAAGVLLGGVLTQYLGWRWILFINVPIALGAAMCTARADRRGPQPRAARAASTCPARWPPPRASPCSCSGSCAPTSPAGARPRRSA